MRRSSAQQIYQNAVTSQRNAIIYRHNHGFEWKNTVNVSECAIPFLEKGEAGKLDRGNQFRINSIIRIPSFYVCNLISLFHLALGL